MSLHGDLAEQAHHLARRERNRPRQASLRRAVSSAYYALFHFLTRDAAVLLAPKHPVELRAQVQRAFSHDEMARVCRQFAAGAPTEATAALISQRLAPEITFMAKSFVRLQQDRYKADYDVRANFNRAVALDAAALATSAITQWARVRGTPQAKVFLTALLLQRHWRN